MTSFTAITKTLMRVGALLVALPLAQMPTSAGAQTFPNKSITVVVPVSAGGAADALARVWANYVSTAIGAAIVVENKPGANGSIAAAFVAKQPPDGYTILLGSTSNMSLNPFTYKSLPYSPIKDFDPVLMLARSDQVLVANPASGIKSLADLVRLAKAKPGSINYGSAGKGNSTHLNVEYLAQAYGIQLQHVPYKGAAPALIGVVSGETQFMSDAIVTAATQVKAGKVVPVAIIGSERSTILPNVPTVIELGLKDFPVGGWYGLVVPKGTPKIVIDRLNSETGKFWADVSVKKRMDALGMKPMPDPGPVALAKTMQDEARIWGPIIDKLGLRND